MKKTLLNLAIVAASAVPVMASAVTLQFQATLTGAAEIPGNNSTATGFSILFYDDFGTASLADDLFSVTTWANGLSKPVNNAHIHGPATVAQTSGVYLDLRTPALPVTGFFNTGGPDGAVSFFSVANGPAPTVLRTQNGFTNVSFLQALQSGLAYANVHTTAFPGGEVRGQYGLVATIPEPETYALLLAGLGLVGWAARRRKVA